MTVFLAEKHRKPCIHADLDEWLAEEAAGRIQRWLQEHCIGVLNVAGPRAGADPKIYRETFDLLEALLAEFESKGP